MRILLISDIHANPWALRAVEVDAGPVDHVLFAGDAVNYGPDPAAVVDWLESHAAIGVRGNHDHAVAFAADPRASAAKQPLALAMRDWTRDCLSPGQTAYLLNLPRQRDCYVCGVKFTMVHATPLDPLYDYRMRPELTKDQLDALVGGIEADVLLTGHTHLPFLRSRGSLQIVNPGSVGQPLDGDPRAAYAIWEEGVIHLKRVEYDQHAVAAALEHLPLSPKQRGDLIDTLNNGRLAAAAKGT